MKQTPKPITPISLMCSTKFRVQNISESQAYKVKRKFRFSSPNLKLPRFKLEFKRFPLITKG